MKIVSRKYKVYQFDELTEEAQDKAIEKLADINVDYEWWDFTVDDAKQIGLIINSFDIDRHNITGGLDDYAIDVAQAIIENHGKNCDTYKLAEQYVKDYNESHKDEDGNRDTEYIDTEFEYALLQEYLSILRQEYEYLTSRESIIDTIKANEYEFTEDGNIFNS